MNETVTEQIKNAFAWRAAVKAYDPSKPVADADVETIIEAGRMSPTSNGLQPLRIIEVCTPELRAKLREAAYGQAQVTDAPRLLIIAARTDIDEAFIEEYVTRTATTRGIDVTTLKGWQDSLINNFTKNTPEGKLAWAGRQAYIAFGAMIETAALIGVDAGPMEGFDALKVNEILGLDALHLSTLGFLVLGYRSDADTWSKMPKVRVAKEDFVIVK